MQIIKSSNPLSILVIDDSCSERAQINAKLTGLGHHIIESPSGFKAIEYIFKDMISFDLVILDVQMPNMDGFETARKIREMEKQHLMEWHPIIFLSGRTDAKMIEKGIDAGGDDYLTKPIETIVLKAKIIAMQRIANMRKELISAKKKLEVLANTDELTQISNLRHFKSLLKAEIDRAYRFDMPFCIAYVDLDNFKRINDTYGHPIGDIVLQSIATLINTNLRSVDNFGRIGGEEFCICFPGTNIKDAQATCERYRLLIENFSIVTDSQTLNVSASFGITLFAPDQDNIKTIMNRADKALYVAKEHGRNRVEIIL